MRISWTFWVGALAVTAACAHDPITTNLTWTGEISRVVYKHCANCHHPGGRAFSLLSYEDARPWAKAMRDEVLARRMPPWGPVKGVGEFRDDPSLSQPEIDLLVSWVEGGAPEGDPVYLPALPHFDAAPAPGSLPRPTAPPRTLASDTAWTLDRPFSLLSVRPLRLAEGGSLELMAVCPDGSVKHLIWIRGYRREWQRTYVFQEPVRLPLGTRLSVRSSMPSAVAIATAKPER